MVVAVVGFAAPPEIVSVRRSQPVERNAAVGRYEKLELAIELRASFDNPFDPDEVDLSAEFTAPSGRVWKILGFYNPADWSAQWMVRFAPVETGKWRYVVKVRDREGQAESKPAEFSVAESGRHGFIRVADNRRYFQFSDGSPFYGVGLWYNDGYEFANGGKITEEGLDNLKQHGANFIGFYPSPLETMATGLGRYDCDRAARLDRLFAWCEARDLSISWNLWFHAYLSEDVWGAGNTRYRSNPYRRVASAEKFFGSEDAWRYEEKLHRYIVARWGYSRALFLWFVVDEINGTEGWRDGGAETAERWCQRVHDWLKANDPYGRATTGTQSGGVKEWWPGGYRIFDVAARELYEAQGHPMPKSARPDWATENPLALSYLNYAKQAQDLWQGFDKPAIIGECGFDHTFYEPGTPGYLATYHNALWTGLANGLCATPFWWSYGPNLNDSVVTRSMLYFSRFVREIDFAHGDWRPVVLTVSHGNGWAMQGAGTTFGWFANPAGGVARETFGLPGIADGNYDVRLFRTWRGEYLDTIAMTATGGTLTVAIPELVPEKGHAQNMGDDVAFVITRRRTADPLR